jgi:hypothetical protein
MALTRYTQLARPSVAIAALALGAWMGLAPSCTIFNGVDYTPPMDLDAGADADAEVDAGPKAEHYLSVLDAAKLCGRVLECPQLAASITISTGVPMDTSNFSACMTWVAGPIPTNRVGLSLQRDVLACVAKAMTCKEAGACLSEEGLASDDARCPPIDPDAGAADAGAAMCTDQDTVLRCLVPDILHCGVSYFESSHCLTGTDGSVWCSSGTGCNENATCVGNVLKYCGAGTGLEFSVNCTAVGATCGVDPKAGSANCLTEGTLQNCTGTGSICQGKKVKVCDNDVLSVFDCARLDADCTKDFSTALCAHAKDECTPYDTGIGDCAGTVLNLCIGGAKSTFDCAKIARGCKTGIGCL